MSHLRRARWGLEIGARDGKLYRCFPRSGVVAMNRAQSNEPDQLVSSTVSITVLSVTPARAKKLFAFASVDDGVQIGVHGIRAMRKDGGDGDRAAQISRCRRRVASSDHPAGRSSLADRQGSVRRARRAGPGRETARRDDAVCPSLGR